MNTPTKTTKKASAPVNALRHHVTGAIERGEATAIVEQKAAQQPQHSPLKYGSTTGNPDYRKGLRHRKAIEAAERSRIETERDEARNHAEKLAAALRETLRDLEDAGVDGNGFEDASQMMREALAEYQKAKGGEAK